MDPKCYIDSYTIYAHIHIHTHTHTQILTQIHTHSYMYTSDMEVEWNRKETIGGWTRGRFHKGEAAEC